MQQEDKQEGVTGGEISSDKNDLQKIIEKNKQQVSVEEPDVENETNKKNIPEPKDQLKLKESQSKEQTEKSASSGQVQQPSRLEEMLLGSAAEAEISQEKRRQILEQLDVDSVKLQQATSNQQKSSGDGGGKQQHLKQHAQEIYDLKDPQQQIDRIVQLAISHDPYYAINVARHLDDNYVLDQIHDRLVEDQVREELLKKGLLSEL